MSKTIEEARECYGDTALMIPCRICRAKRGDFCAPTPGATWSIHGDRIYMGDAKLRERELVATLDDALGYWEVWLEQHEGKLEMPGACQHREAYERAYEKLGPVLMPGYCDECGRQNGCRSPSCESTRRMDPQNPPTPEQEHEIILGIIAEHQVVDWMLPNNLPYATPIDGSAPACRKSPARVQLLNLTSDIAAVLGGHLDNTGMLCRIDLDDHDCCYTCNRVGAMLRAMRAEERS